MRTFVQKNPKRDFEHINQCWVLCFVWAPNLHSFFARLLMITRRTVESFVQWSLSSFRSWLSLLVQPISILQSHNLTMLIAFPSLHWRSAHIWYKAIFMSQNSCDWTAFANFLLSPLTEIIFLISHKLFLAFSSYA